MGDLEKATELTHKEKADRLVAAVADNLNRNVTAQAIINEMARRAEGHCYGPELQWHLATPEFVERFNAAWAARKSGPTEVLVRDFVDAWPPGVPAMRFGSERLWPAALRGKL